MSDLPSCLAASQQDTWTIHVSFSPLEKNTIPSLTNTWAMRNGSSMPTAVLQPRVPKGLQKCKLFYFCEKLNCHCRKAGAGHALGWALAAPFRDQLWLIGLERSPFPCIVWGLQFLQYLLGIPVALRSNKKALKQVNVFHISVFQVEFVGYPATMAVSLTV